ncbi:uncharacterized protein LOC117649612 isoform X2 [Thrips palmi]|uniref:Uncharacterized protein LOC117649612 isoform X2 n=1 Tax=Thrips palmi TaxID=161013 RepID=A0A6P8ZT58_THRPL|nr:uncharacterized protein LOC117649612 isoform X2 [Thrips palmi]
MKKASIMTVSPLVPSRQREEVHSFFDGLQPLAYVAAVLAIVPIGLQPIRICFDPRRSTLVYALVVQGFVVWALLTTWAQHQKPSSDEDWAQKFHRTHTFVHLMGWVVVPVVWVEGRNFARLESMGQHVMNDFGDLIEGSAGQRCLKVWVAVALVVLGLNEGSSRIAFAQYGNMLFPAIPAHMYINCLLVLGVAVPALCCRRVQVAANSLANTLRREPHRGQLTPQRATAYRGAWLNLAKLNAQLIATPVSTLLLGGVLVFMVVLHMYEGIEKTSTNNSQVGLAQTMAGWLHLVLLFVLCEIPHRSSGAVREQFIDVLQKPYAHVCDPRTCEELHRFLEVVWWSTSTTTILNTFELKRSTFKTVMAVSFTYAMVMFQFHVSMETPCRPPASVSQP